MSGGSGSGHVQIGDRVQHQDRERYCGPVADVVEANVSVVWRREELPYLPWPMVEILIKEGYSKLALKKYRPTAA